MLRLVCSLAAVVLANFCQKVALANLRIYWRAVSIGCEEGVFQVGRYELKPSCPCTNIEPIRFMKSASRLNFVGNRKYVDCSMDLHIGCKGI